MPVFISRKSYLHFAFLYFSTFSVFQLYFPFEFLSKSSIYDQSKLIVTVLLVQSRKNLVTKCSENPEKIFKVSSNFCQVEKNRRNREPILFFLQQVKLFYCSIVLTFTLILTRQNRIYRQSPIFLLLTKNFRLVISCKYGNFSSFLDSLLTFHSRKPI